MNKLVIFALLFAILLLVDTDAWWRRRRRRRTRRRKSWLGHVVTIGKWAVRVKKWAKHTKTWIRKFGDESMKAMTFDEIAALHDNEEFRQMLRDAGAEEFDEKAEDELLGNADHDGSIGEINP